MHPAPAPTRTRQEPAMTTDTFTPDLVEGMELAAPVAGHFISAEPITYHSNDEPRSYLVRYSSWGQDLVYVAADNEPWHLYPQPVFGWEPDELHYLKDGDSWTFMAAEVATADEARAWVARHYPAATFEVLPEGTV